MDDSGALTLEELKAALMAKNAMSEPDCDMLFKICDADMDSLVTMMEFSRGLKKWSAGFRLPLPPPPPPAVSAPAALSGQCLLVTFSEADVDDSGRLSKKELRAALHKKHSVTDEECDMLFKMCDANNDHSVTMMGYARGLKKWNTGVRLGSPTSSPPSSPPEAVGGR